MAGARNDDVIVGPGTSNRSCHDDFVGPSPFSEPEARAMSEFLMSLRRPAGDDNVDNGLVGYISLHSYGQHWLTPWGYTQTQPDDYRDMVSQHYIIQAAKPRS